jgi:hypothetical protein
MLKAVRIRTAFSMDSPLARPKVVDKITVAMPAAPANPQASQRDQKLREYRICFKVSGCSLLERFAAAVVAEKSDEGRLRKGIDTSPVRRAQNPRS